MYKIVEHTPKSVKALEQELNKLQEEGYELVSIFPKIVVDKVMSVWKQQKMHGGCGDCQCK